MSANTTVLISGASRGLGKALTAHYLSQPAHTVIAAVRDPKNDTAAALSELPKDTDSKLVVVKIDSSSETDALEAVAELQSKHGIEKLDLVIANAAAGGTFPLVRDAKPQSMQAHDLVNVSSSPKLIVMGSAGGSIGLMEQAPVPNATYGTSKAALHYVSRKIHFEEEYLTVVILHPGFVQTDMGNYSARVFGLEKAFLTVEESISGCIKVISNATRENSSGKLLQWNGEGVAW